MHALLLLTNCAKPPPPQQAPEQPAEATTKLDIGSLIGATGYQIYPAFRVETVEVTTGERADARETVQQDMPKLEECWLKATLQGSVEAQIDIDATGTVAGVAVAPGELSTKVGPCLEQALATLQFSEGPGASSIAITFVN